MKYHVTATVTFEVEVDAVVMQTEIGRERDAEAIIEARLDDDDTVIAYSMSASRPLKVGD